MLPSSACLPSFPSAYITSEAIRLTGISPPFQLYCYYGFVFHCLCCDISVMPRHATAMPAIPLYALLVETAVGSREPRLHAADVVRH